MAALCTRITVLSASVSSLSMRDCSYQAGNSIIMTDDYSINSLVSMMKHRIQSSSSANVGWELTETSKLLGLHPRTKNCLPLCYGSPRVGTSTCFEDDRENVTIPDHSAYWTIIDASSSTPKQAIVSSSDDIGFVLHNTPEALERQAMFFDITSRSSIRITEQRQWRKI